MNLPGGADLAHQLINTGSVDLVYLAISTQVLPEAVGYPDCGKTGVRTVWSKDKSGRFLISDSAKNSVQYWQGDDGAHVASTVAPRKE